MRGRESAPNDVGTSAHSKASAPWKLLASGAGTRECNGLVGSDHAQDGCVMLNAVIRGLMLGWSDHGHSLLRDLHFPARGCRIYTSHAPALGIVLSEIKHFPSNLPSNHHTTLYNPNRGRYTKHFGIPQLEPSSSNNNRNISRPKPRTLKGHQFILHHYIQHKQQSTCLSSSALLHSSAKGSSQHQHELAMSSQWKNPLLRT
jgi:hypothetical protein